MQTKDLQIDRERLAEICRRYGAIRLEIFGSFTRGDAGPDSDLDIMVTFKPDASDGFEFVQFQQELELLFGRPVDLLSRRSIEQSPNKYFRRFALRNTELLYGR